jgi:thiol-disulfide isomerase/thioredoxin
VGTGTVGIPTVACDLLDAANAGWSKLTPPQRALDAASVMDDASLWPDEVKTRRPVRVDGPLGLQKTLPAGTPLWLAVYDKQGVYLYPPGLETHVNVKFEGTDMLAVAREKVLIEKEKRPSRLIDGLRSIMLDSSGKPFTNPGLDDTKVFIFYYGANWCQPCHQFSPLLVKWVNENAAKNPHMTVVMLDADEKDADMLKYLTDEKMPWPTVRMTAWKQSHVFAANQREGYPQLLITDRWGKIIYNEVGGGPSDIKLHMENLAKLSESGAGH